MVSKTVKETLRYVLLALLMMGAYDLGNRAYVLEETGKLTMQYAGIVGVYLGVWGYVIKSFFTSKVES